MKRQITRNKVLFIKQMRNLNVEADQFGMIRERNSIQSQNPLHLYDFMTVCINCYTFYEQYGVQQDRIAQLESQTKQQKEQIDRYIQLINSSKSENKERAASNAFSTHYFLSKNRASLQSVSSAGQGQKRSNRSFSYVAKGHNSHRLKSLKQSFDSNYTADTVQNTLDMTEQANMAPVELTTQETKTSKSDLKTHQANLFLPSVDKSAHDPPATATQPSFSQPRYRKEFII